ncbi:prepilin peptidase [Streptococcus moroccensis]|uniref:Leader peptidase (Prepilin peptidase)/N-methyltransferase n=1 Tax=Streptococcus moroccensis TaxID=1451356 RepID=A0ABT9YND6_9STRE|nr:A24 family peptidase [Streptococcus moroccensis]MDQ0221500.1 leader peptidase (prepilin peptidase)/N-methyltransferase [Streptococcus moroccensis]
MRYILLFFMGASFGSFFGLVITRFPDQSIVTPSSHCDHCQHKLACRDLVPIFSQLANLFRCRFCQQPFSSWYWLLEIACGSLFLLAFLDLLSWGELIVSYTLLVLAIYDSKNQTYPLMVWLVFFVVTSLLVPWQWSTLICFLLAGLSQFGYLPMGAGDFLVLASISLVFSVQELLWLLQLASLLGIAYYAIRKTKGSIPFVPFMGLAYVALMLVKVW